MKEARGVDQKKNDQYTSFAELAAQEERGVDYDFSALDRDSPVAIVASHRGWIEYGTSQLATAVAGDDFSLYLFEGLKPKRPHRGLHIGSEYFNEKQCVKLVTKAQLAIGMHGRADGDDTATIWLGGLGKELRDALAVALKAAGFKAITLGHRLPGEHKNNICNRGNGRAGVQLELPKTLRHALVADAGRRALFSGAVRKTVLKHLGKPGPA
ncbi:poly-gamma-glutamate hydrolase family protein (plasmid) [Mesorhizobium sp. AR07]|uniref:poly-gamma-glutamate hydrolase family protein n=1 Tax=Mesorhizobium sp. AR07 TaxID=2865838 RepID=UPI002160B276|nr:poly-gamma-glutamate hydrolase family protein [Mesorhizobium sp. AR07]UVK49018.1 poly-gamma-glutamate hydrolase family protein [Mesorhizobium sp. AR07]